MYADECAEIRKIARLVLANQLVLEKVTVRLETVMQLGDIVGKDLLSIVSLVQDMKGKMSGLIPTVANELEQINSALVDMTSEIGRTEAINLRDMSKEEAGKVLVEAAALAELKMKEQYTQLPLIEPSATSPKRKPENEPQREPEPLETRIYKYALEQAGRFNVEKCASVLGVSRNEVERCVERLVDDGRISLERE
jgi:hypothetical protein